MSVAVFVASRLLGSVRHALVEEGHLTIATSWEDLERIIRREPVSAAIVDPGADGIVKSDAIAGLMSRFPSLPLVAYVIQGPRAFSAIAELSRRGLHHVMIHRFDDSPERFQETVRRVQADECTKAMLNDIGDWMSSLPVGLAGAVETMFARPHRYSSAIDLAMAAGIPSVRLYRSFEAARMGSPKRLLIAAKLLRGCGYLQDPGYSVKDVAVKLGYRHSKIFIDHCVTVFGLTPSRVRKRITQKDAQVRIARWLRDSGESLEDERRERSGTH